MWRWSVICRRRQQFRPGQSSPAVIVEYGRRQLIQHPYLLPKDGQEYNRLDFQHFYLKALFGTNYFAPLPRQVSAILHRCAEGLTLTIPPPRLWQSCCVLQAGSRSA